MSASIHSGAFDISRPPMSDSLCMLVHACVCVAHA